MRNLNASYIVKDEKNSHAVDFVKSMKRFYQNQDIFFMKSF